MAAFTSPDDGIKAAIKMQAEMQKFNQLSNQASGSRNNQLVLKIGVHAGACISVTLNDRADYFGTAINIAARVQALSQGNDIVFTADLLDRVKAISALKNYIDDQSFVTLRGISEPIAIFRMKVSKDL